MEGVVGPGEQRVHVAFAVVVVVIVVVDVVVGSIVSRIFFLLAVGIFCYFIMTMIVDTHASHCQVAG